MKLSATHLHRSVGAHDALALVGEGVGVGEGEPEKQPDELPDETKEQLEEAQEGVGDGGDLAGVEETGTYILITVTFGVDDVT